MDRAQAWRVRLLGFVVVAAILIAGVPHPRLTTIETIRRTQTTFCVLQADPSDKFTRVPPPAVPGTRFNITAATITVNYSGFSPAAQAAFQYAVDIWQSQLNVSIPVRVNATFEPLSANTLGSAGATYVYRDFGGAALLNTWYAKGLANNLAGSDLDPSEVDIVASFNSGFTWYYGTDGLTPAGHYDFVSVVLHELAHGLGFFGSAQVASGIGSWGWATGFPHIYDRFVENASGQALLNTALFPNPSSALAAQLQSNALYWYGQAAITNYGQRPRIYAPDRWQSGSSYSHVDEASYPPGDPDSLMTYAIGAAEAIHDPGPIVRGMLSDEGWSVANAPCDQVTVSASGSSPFVVGSPVTWTARATGCGSPEYRFWLYSQSSGAWTDLRTWSASDSASWIPTQAGSYILQVWARESGSTALLESWTSTGWFQVNAAAPCSGTSLSSSLAFPVPVGTAVTWTAHASGCSAPEYMFWLYSAGTGTWTILRSWSSTSSATWTPTTPDTYIVQVWTRNIGSAANVEAWASSGQLVVTGSTTRCTSVSLASNAVFPVSVGTQVTWTAQASGCPLPQYQFWLYSTGTGTWTELRGWSSTNTATWHPLQAGTYLVQAWTRNADSGAAFDAWTSSGYVGVRVP